MGNTFGRLFRVTTFGESHGGGIGVVIDGCPPNIDISDAEVQRELDRRRPGQSKLTTQRKEEDRCEILSGVFEGKTLGTPIAILVRNKDARPEDYGEIARKFRPSHADFTYEAKYGIRNWQGGGRVGARDHQPGRSGCSREKDIVGLLLGVRDRRLRRADSPGHCENQSLHCENERRREKFDSLSRCRGGEEDDVAYRRNSRRRRLGWWRD